MDNVIFSVNGSSNRRLQMTLDLVMADEYGKTSKVRGAKKTTQGLEFYFYSLPKDVCEFPVPLDVDGVMAFIIEYLKDDKSIKRVTHEKWEGDYDHDGSNSKGWRVYTSDWGHISDGCKGFAVKPVYCWHSK